MVHALLVLHLAAMRPHCGRLAPSSLRDHDALCVQVAHSSSFIGELQLYNSTALGTRVSELPNVIAPGTASWFVVEDGISWGRARMDQEGSTLTPFHFSAIYRGVCLSAAANCPTGRSFYEVTVTVSLERIASGPAVPTLPGLDVSCSDSCRLSPCGSLAGDLVKQCGLCKGYRFLCRPGVPGFPPLDSLDANVSALLARRAPTFVGEHAVAITFSSSAGGFQPLRVAAEWKPCILAAKVSVADGGSRATAGLPAPATRAVRSVSSRDDEAATCSTIIDDTETLPTEGSTSSVNLKNEPTACEMMAAANATNAAHIKYFLMQQQAEVRFLEAAEQQLCPSGAVPTEADFQRTLHQLLKPVRMAVRLHISMAFMAKSDCARNAAVDRKRAMNQVQLLQLPSYADGYFHLKRTPGQKLVERHEGAPAGEREATERRERAQRDVQQRAAAQQSSESQGISSIGVTYASGEAGMDPAVEAVHSEDAFGRDTWLHLMMPFTHDENRKVAGHSLWLRPVLSVDPKFLPDQPDPDPDWCPLPILHHEPYNTRESWHFWNVTSHLMQAGAGFCTAPAATRRALFTKWSARLGEVMAHHRGNNAFIVYFAAYEPPCRRLVELREARGLKPTEDASGTKGVRRWANTPQPFTNWRTELRLAQQDEEQRLTDILEEMRRNGDCDPANVSAVDLISAFGNDTQLTLALGKALLTASTKILPGSGGRPAERNCARLAPERVQAIVASIGPLAADHRAEIGLNQAGAWSLTLATAYHKLVPMCAAADPLYGRLAPDNWQCTESPLPSEPDGKLAYDLIPMNAERGYCYGPFCAPAARAIDAYRQYLHVLSHLRTVVVHSILSGQCPFGDDGAFLRELLTMRDELPPLMAKLRAAQPGLGAACVVPSRTAPHAVSENWERAKQIMAERLAAQRGRSLVSASLDNDAA